YIPHPLDASSSFYSRHYFLSCAVFPLSILLFFLMIPPPPRSTLFPYTTLFRSDQTLSVQLGRQISRPFWIDTVGRSNLVSIQNRSEEHTSELQSPYDLVCRLLLEKKKKIKKQI